MLSGRSKAEAVRVVVLEDNLFFVPRLEGKVRELGFDCVMVATLEQAKDALSDEAGAVIVDLHASGALEFVKHTKAGSRAQVLAFCGHSEIELRKKAKKAGVDVLIPNSELLPAIDAVLRKHRAAGAQKDSEETPA